MDQDTKEEDDMLPEYDFKGGKRGKFYRTMQKGVRVRIENDDGTETVSFYKADRLIRLAPDVSEYFPDEESVNNVLRGFITIIERLRKTA